MSNLPAVAWTVDAAGTSTFMLRSAGLGEPVVTLGSGGQPRRVWWPGSAQIEHAIWSPGYGVTVVFSLDPEASRIYCSGFTVESLDAAHPVSRRPLDEAGIGRFIRAARAMLSAPVVDGVVPSSPAAAAAMTLHHGGVKAPSAAELGVVLKASRRAQRGADVEDLARAAFVAALADGRPWVPAVGEVLALDGVAPSGDAVRKAVHRWRVRLGEERWPRPGGGRPPTRFGV